MIDQLMQHTAPNGAAIRTLTLEGKPYFIGRDVAQALGYKVPISALNQHCEEQYAKHIPLKDSRGVEHNARIIDEADVYSLIFGSKLPEARAFKRWVTSEVLPAIRQQGGYMAPLPQETPEQLLARALKVANATLERTRAELEDAHKEIDRREEERHRLILEQVVATHSAEDYKREFNAQWQINKENAPKVTFAEAVEVSGQTFYIGEVAKLLCQRGVKMGRTRLFKWLREKNWLGQDNLPLQRGMEKAFFVIHETQYRLGEDIKFNLTTKVTAKGAQYILAQFLKPSTAT